jgi:hypothetical protein
VQPALAGLSYKVEKASKNLRKECMRHHRLGLFGNALYKPQFFVVTSPYEVVKAALWRPSKSTDF